MNMEHPAFVDAGSSPGIEIWTIDNFEPVPIEKKMYGKFYNGDSYIVLKTNGTSNSTLTYDAHFWLGSKTTQDKKGTAAIMTVTLDDQLGGKAVHHREVQGHESTLFLGYFKPAIRYLEGGLESGFNEVEINAGAVKRLLRLSGCDNMRIEEVPAEGSSLTKEHCFILEVDHDIFVLMPEGAKATQRRKIISIANDLRDDYHNGRATIEIIDEFSSDDDIDAFFEALGSGCKEDIADDQSTETFDRGNAVYLYMVMSGEEIELVEVKKPYKQSSLNSDAIYILDTPDSDVFVWLGNDVDYAVKKNYFDIAQQYFNVKGYPAWVRVTRISEGSESTDFKQYFHQWETINAFNAGRNAVSIDAGYFSGDAEESAATAKLIGKSAAARGYMPDHGEGNCTVIRIAGEQEDVTEQLMAEVSVLYQSEVYVVKYKYTNEDGDDAHVVYLWIGADASSDDKATGVELMKELQNELLEENATFVKIPQGKENKHFLNIFKGNLIILFGGKDTDYQAENFNKTYSDDGIRLFRVEGTELGVDMRAVQVKESADELEDDDVFVLETVESVYVRSGKESDTKELEAALTFVGIIIKDKEIIQLEQGDEPEEFWTALGGAPSDTESRSGWLTPASRRLTTDSSLTAVTVTRRNKIIFEELSKNYTQEDLSDDGVYILDTGEELYIWQGANTPSRVRDMIQEIIKDYIADDGLDRTVESALVIYVKQNKEPAIFKKHFPGWDNEMWQNQTSYEDIKNNTKGGNSK